MRTTPGAPIEPAALRSHRARELCNYATSARREFINLIGCTADERREIVLIELDLSVAQRPKISIAPREPIAVYFPADGSDGQPSFVPLRDDFPDDVLHLMAGDGDTPPSLCIWDVPFSELRATLTPVELVRQLKTWLEKSADGALHEPDQPLEPVLLASGAVLIVPADPSSHHGKIVHVTSVSQSQAHRFVVRLSDPDSASRPPPNASRFILGVFETPRRKQRAVGSAPGSLGALHSALMPTGFDLAARLEEWVRAHWSNEAARSASPIILIRVPKVRSDDPEETPTDEYWAFCSIRSLQDIGVALGYLAKVGDTVAPVIGRRPTPELTAIDVDTMAVVSECERADLPLLSGLSREGNDLRLVLIGAGAIGSKIAVGAARCGFGRWTIVDEDFFFPHNVARHALGDWAIGHPKAHGLGQFMNRIAPGTPAVRSIEADVLASGINSDLAKALDEADVVVDASASVPVARHLASRPGARRCVSAFLSSQGTDLVILAEDSARTIDLWDLEAAYYRTIVSTDLLADHLNLTGPRRRYGNGCRDRTAPISDDAVSTLGAIAVRQLSRVLGDNPAFGGIWRYDPVSGGVTPIPITFAPSAKLKLLDWEVCWSRDLIERLAARRASKLPNETGGVLLGVVDREHRRIVVVDEIPAPADSIERPLLFVRGNAGVSQELDRVSAATAGQLRYVGEWHSHPRNSDSAPSPIDEKLFADLRDKFLGSAEPYMMTIISDRSLFARLGLDHAAADAVLDLDHHDVESGGVSSGR